MLTSITSIEAFFVMMPRDLKETELRVTSLRAELKQWEKTFALRNNSQKPGREDIKQDPAIGWFDSLNSF